MNNAQAETQAVAQLIASAPTALDKPSNGVIAKKTRQVVGLPKEPRRSYNVDDMPACNWNGMAVTIVDDIRFNTKTHKRPKAASIAYWQAYFKGCSEQKVRTAIRDALASGLLTVTYKMFNGSNTPHYLYAGTGVEFNTPVEINTPHVEINTTITDCISSSNLELKAVDESTSTLPGNPQTLTAEVKPQNQPLKAYEVWKKNVQMHFPENYIEPKATDIKNLGPKMRRLYKSDVTDYLAFLEWITSSEGFDNVRYEWNGIWNGDVNKLANPPHWPDLPFLLNERNLAVAVAIYRHVTKPAPTPEQQEQDHAAYEAEYQAHKAEQQAAIKKANAEIAAEKAAKQASTPAPAPVPEPVVVHFLTAADYEPCDEPPEQAKPDQMDNWKAEQARQKAMLAKNKATMFQKHKHVEAAAA